MIIHEVEQNTPEWLELRKNKFTASNFGKLFMAKTTAGYNELINRVVFERVTGELPESYSNEYMQRGHDLEPEAIQRYEFETFRKVKRIGFVEMNEFIGCSPDGFVGDKGMVQVKVPKYSTLIDYMISNKIPKDYSWQMQGELWICEREWNDFFVYHPNLEPLRIRVSRDEAKIKELESEIEIAIETVQERINLIRKAS